MEDIEIVELYWNRCEHAIAETDKKYGTYCFVIARRILEDPEDARECTNDTWLDAWNAMPPHRPSILSTFLGKITRRISIDRWRRRNAYKRGGSVLVFGFHRRHLPTVWILTEQSDLYAPQDPGKTAEAS